MMTEEELEVRKQNELFVLHRLAAKHGYALVSIEDGLDWKDDD